MALNYQTPPNRQGQSKVKGFDVFAKTGDDSRAHVETAQTETPDGKLLITFTPQVETPRINGIEMIPGW